MRVINNPTEIPEWLARLPGNARLNSEEMSKLWGYKNRETFIVSYAQGKIPIESSKTPSSVTTGYMRFWKVSDVRNFIRAEKRKQQEKS